MGARNLATSFARVLSALPARAQSLVRSFDVGGQREGCVADDENAWFFVGGGQDLQADDPGLRLPPALPSARPEGRGRIAGVTPGERRTPGLGSTSSGPRALGVVLFGLHDDSKRRERTRRLVRATVPFLEELVTLGSLPILRGLAKDGLALAKERRESRR